MTAISDLLERVEKATGPDREIDTDLCLALSYIGCFDAPINLRRSEDANWLDYEADEDGDGRLVDCTDVAPELTGSIDAALALVERKLPGAMISLVQPARWQASVLEVDPDNPDAVAEDRTEDADTAPLAIIAALLRALESETPA